MNWQDLVFFAGGWVFVISLIPTLKGKQKPEVITSVTTSTILFAFTVSFATLGLWLSASSNLATAIAWAVLAYQRYRQPKNTK